MARLSLRQSISLRNPQEMDAAVIPRETQGWRKRENQPKIRQGKPISNAIPQLVDRRKPSAFTRNGVNRQHEKWPNRGNKTHRDGMEWQKDLPHKNGQIQATHNKKTREGAP
jgi:hypothetical protein